MRLPRSKPDLLEPVRPLYATSAEAIRAEQDRDQGASGGGIPFIAADRTYPR